MFRSYYYQHSLVIIIIISLWDLTDALALHLAKNNVDKAN